jgi:hypothetical protein
MFATHLFLIALKNINQSIMDPYTKLHMSDLILRVPKTCDRGSSYEKGGLNVEHIQMILHELNLSTDGDRTELIDRLCKNRSRVTDIGLDERAPPPRMTIGGVEIAMAPVFKLTPNCQPRAFVQKLDLCWFHASSVAMFFSDMSRTSLWPLLFNFHPKTMIPLSLRETSMPPTNVLILEMIRRAIELSEQQETIGRSRRASIDMCTRGSFDMVCSVSPWCSKKTTHEGRAMMGSEYIGGGHSAAMLKSFSTEFPDNIMTYQEVKYGQDLDNMVDSFVVSYSPQGHGRKGHAVAFYMCNGKWYFYDNNSPDVPFGTLASLSPLYATDNPSDIIDKSPLSGQSDTIKNIIGLSFTAKSASIVYATNYLTIPLERCNKVINLVNFIGAISNADTLRTFMSLLQTHPVAFSNIFGLDESEQIMNRLIADKLSALDAPSGF